MRFFTPLAIGLLGLGLAGQVKAGSILYFSDGTIGTDEMAAALAALSGTYSSTTAASASGFLTDLGTGSYQLAIFFDQDFLSTDYTAEFAALATFVQDGHLAIVDDWDTADGSSVIAPLGADFTGDTNGSTMDLTAFNASVTNPVTLTNPGWSIAFSTGLSLDATFGDSIAATFTDLSGEGAIVTGNGGRSIVNGFLSDTAGAPGEQIYINEINGVFSTVPEPSTLTLAGLGLLCAFAYRRLR